jgi:hypothetical protein
VQDAESRLVTGQAKLPLDLHRRHAGRLAGDEVGRPEPDAEGRMTALHHRAHGQARLAAAGPASQDAGPGGDAERFAHNAAVGAGKAFAPACLFQIGGAGGVVGEKPLELGERFREGEVGAIENVHSHPLIRFRHTGPPCRVRQSDNHVVRGKLDVVGVCVNRIGMDHPIRFAGE